MRIPEEGDECPECYFGKLIYDIEGCTCFISPPCGVCTDTELSCDRCGWDYEEHVGKEDKIVWRKRITPYKRYLTPYRK